MTSSLSASVKEPMFWVRAVASVAAYFLLASISVSIDTDYWYGWWNEALLWMGIVGGCVGLLTQRFKPVTGLWITAVSMALIGLSGMFAFSLGYAVVCYEAYFISSRIRSHRRAWLAALVVGSFATLVWYIIYNVVFRPTFPVPESPTGLSALWSLFGDVTFWVFTVIVSFLVVASIGSAWLWGKTVFRRNQEVEILSARAELATVSERNRIAREMHDIVAHSLTGIIAQADGGRYAGKKDPQVAIDALDTIAASSRESLRQMRSLLSVLHDDTPRDRGAVPGAAALPGLISDAQRNGITVSLHTEGIPLDVDEAQSLTIYRVVQECLTNILKHAGSVEAQVVVRWEPDYVKITVDNAPGSDSGEGSGRGLTGIRERVRIYGGRASWGESEVYGGGWNVSVMIPVEAK
ncbi:sensor histidine kinase [Corynebacterium sp. 320]|uniref:ATP-binding protein n=1 Tax=Corynebacterium TaxID=1716 RepID=UPI00125CC49F|nr:MULTISPECIES: sensor histidine kinase [Corynebacterium]KAB1504187.1 sensor histidine kinase [Corynebacterium sp. 320]KAB1552713.1 sensor histidine kinase [Corynebacterium sp. 321]KAB1554069.1 sensor histidine kinase [Corynebacterium sp. 319]KAB3528323.1 sensor histidine kinase [Corynebacterium sp. 250]KAB3540188.1 sensor histidine kinase [Corynebacterium sp. 366]